MKNDVLYPVNYDESTAVVPETSSEGRDVAATKSFIRSLVPEGGEPLTLEQIVKLVSGGYGNTRGVDLKRVSVVDVNSDQATAVQLVRAGLKRGQAVRGLTAGKNLLPSEVRALIQEVIDERRGSWKPKKPNIADAFGVGAVERGQG